ncbi:MAG TPA: ABC transporter substrate-binding protein [Gaiellaceae bacterium]|nr:ABC transporter substrate-binding protein [Gaiellaceae bacterium]
MAVNRRKLGSLVGVLVATAVAAGGAAASQQGTPGVTKKQIVIGGTFPFTGPAALYKTIPAAEAAYYAYVNAHGGVFHRKIKDITLDDQYDPAQTLPQTKKLVQKDHVFAVVGSLGTAPILSTWTYLNKRKIPQVLVATGDAYWGECARHKCAASKTAKPWTMGWQPDYPGEAKVYAKYILKTKPHAKIGVLYQNDAYGTNYLAGLKAGLGSHKNQIVDAESYSVGDSAQVIGAHVVALRAHGADTFVIFATPAPTIQALVARTLTGWSPLTLVNNVSANRVFELAAAQNGANLNGIISTAYLASPTTQANLKGMKLAKAIIHATGNQALEQSLAQGDGNIVYGLASAWTFVDALKHAGRNLTRPGLMKALRNLNESGKDTNPFVYPGMTVKTSKKRAFPMEQLKLERWSGGAGGDWHTFGKLYSGVH